VAPNRKGRHGEGISVITAMAMPAMTSNLVKMGPVVVGVARNDAVVRLVSLWGTETVRLKSVMALFLRGTYIKPMKRSFQGGHSLHGVSP
jgi:hypothetical protein